MIKGCVFNLVDVVLKQSANEGKTNIETQIPVESRTSNLIGTFSGGFPFGIGGLPGGARTGTGYGRGSRSWVVNNPIAEWAEEYRQKLKYYSLKKCRKFGQLQLKVFVCLCL